MCIRDSIKRRWVIPFFLLFWKLSTRNTVQCLRPYNKGLRATVVQKYGPTMPSPRIHEEENRAWIVGERPVVNTSHTPHRCGVWNEGKCLYNCYEVISVLARKAPFVSKWKQCIYINIFSSYRGSAFITITRMDLVSHARELSDVIPQRNQSASETYHLFSVWISESDALHMNPSAACVNFELVWLDQKAHVQMCWNEVDRSK